MKANAQSLMKTSSGDFLSSVVSFFLYFLSLVQKVTFWSMGKGVIVGTALTTNISSKSFVSASRAIFFFSLRA